MKKQLFIIEFAVIFLFFILPPLFMSPATGTQKEAVYSAGTFVLAAAAGVIYIQRKKELADDNAGKKNILFFLIKSGDALVTFGFLCLTAAVTGTVAYFAGTVQYSVVLPHTFLSLCNCIAGTVCAAFYEEVLYRCYFPESMNELFLLFKKKTESSAWSAWSAWSERIRTALCEIVPVLFFAAAHRYLGIWGIVNAAAGGVFLRLCMKRSGTIWTGTAAHALYNFFMLIASSFIK